MIRGHGPLARILRIGAPDGPRFLLSTALGAAAALCTVGLLACSGALIDKAALRPPLYTLTLLMAAVQLLALGRGPLRYAERLVSHDAALGALGRVRLWLYDQIAPRSPAGVAGWRDGDLLARATADVDLLQDVYLRGVAPLLVAGVTAAVTVAVVTLVLPVGGLVLAVFLLGGCAAASGLAWVRAAAPRDGRGRTARRARRRRGRAAGRGAGPGGDGSRRRVPGAGPGVGRRARAPGAAPVVVRRRGVRSRRCCAPGGRSSGCWPCRRRPSPSTGCRASWLPCCRWWRSARSRWWHRRRTPWPGWPTTGRPRHAWWRWPTCPSRSRTPRRRHPSPIGCDVALEDAVLRYTVGGPRVLDGLSLSVPEGRHLAVVGPSGAGKSSIVNVLLRFWGLESGTARLGGTSLDDLAQDDVRSRIGWVGQDAHLFPTTIGGNIAVARPGATSAEIAEAARRAQLGPWIDSLPDGMDTPVGERGARLSGGQRQRVALARALLAGCAGTRARRAHLGAGPPHGAPPRRRRGDGIRRDDRRLHHPPGRRAQPLRRRGRRRRRPGGRHVPSGRSSPSLRPGRWGTGRSPCRPRTSS